MRRPFYGWVIAWTCCSIQAVSYGVQFSFGVLLADIEDDTGWSRAGVSLAYSVYVLGYSALSFVSGSLTDRWGPRAVVATGGVLLGAGYALTGAAGALWQLYLTLGVLAAAGMSAAFVPCNATVVRWFEQRRGQALSISTAGSPVGNLVVPPLVGLLAASVGWRVSYVVLGVVVAVWLVGASTLLVRSPEDRGLVVDGAPSTGGSPGSPPLVPAGGDRSPGEALRTSRFWLIGAIFACTWIAVFFPLVHLAPYAEALGASRSVAATMVSAIGVGGLVGRLVIGSMSDRVGRHATLAAVLAVEAFAFGVFAAAPGALALYPAAVAFGFGYGASTTLFPAVIADHFGRRHAGTIVGLLFAGAGSLAAIGPAAAGYLYDTTGSYKLAFVLSGATNLAAVALIAWLRYETRRGGAGPASAGG